MALASGCEDAPLGEWLQHVLNSWVDGDEAFETAVSQKQLEDEVGTDHRGYLFLAQLNGGEVIPSYLHSEAGRLMVKQALEAFDRGTRRRGACYACGAPDREVLGSFSVLKCYNFDKRGTIAGGFDVKRQPGRNFPICEKCAVDLVGAINFAVEQGRLTSWSAGQNYLVLPSAATPEARHELLSALQEQPARFSLARVRDLLANDDDLLAIIRQLAAAGLQDHLSISLFFFLEEKASWRIQGEVQQVLPSRLAKLDDARRTIADDPLLRIGSRPKKGKAAESRPTEVSTRTLQTFSGQELDKKSSQRLVRQWLEALFARRPVDRRALLHQLVRVIRATWRQTPAWAHGRVREAWALYRFFYLTDLIQAEDYMSPEMPQSPFGVFCKEHPEFFARQEAVTAFLMGCYCSVVSSVQYKARKSTPFAQKYQGRSLNGRYLRRLYSEARSKLAQYRALRIVASGLDPDLAEAFVACGEGWSLSDDETTFAFNLGLSLQYRIGSQSGTANDELPSPEDDDEVA